MLRKGGKCVKILLMQSFYTTICFGVQANSFDGRRKITCVNFSSPLRNKSCSEMEIRMKINEYQKLAMTTLNPELSKRNVLINSVMGLCGESGEAIDIVKKWMAQ